MPPPQAFISTYAPRLRAYANSLLTPVIPTTTSQNAPLSRTTKRGTIAINYAEDGYDDEDFEENERSRRPTGLRSLRTESSNIDTASIVEKVGKEISAPVEVQGIWREWMGKPKTAKTERHLQAQTALPLTLIPIRIDIDIPSFTPPPSLPLPSHTQEFGVNPTLAAYKPPDPTLPFRLKDVFLWNLHETLITPDQFALVLVNDLDLPNPASLSLQICNQIRSQLEEYAGVALHPLFHSTVQQASTNGAGPKSLRAANSRDHSATPLPSANLTSVSIGARQTAEPETPSKAPITNGLSATAAPIPAALSDEHNPDDTYRCIITLNINLLNKLYTDKFEWSLLHPPGCAERFAKLTCADLGLAGEWVPAITHAIYEAVLRLKKEACESGGLVGGNGEIDNLAANGAEAGWRFDNEHLAEEWGPRVETLSQEEIDKREGDRERQIRRLRRETARFSSSAGMPYGAGFFDSTDAGEVPLGRGERTKKKRRFRSISPTGRGGTPGVRGTPDAGASAAPAGYGGGGGLADWERQSWRCAHCQVWGSGVWAVRDGPDKPRSLCNNCGLLYERDRSLPEWSKNLHLHDPPAGR
ncbi:MAG: Chromatin structure remodeling complex protein sfh1 [Trizodia sp. TS-e1964]|nr:MAG: Chromatin structure remodeling complex protein sfh1 [Trizodia sp. TS-e1964]